MKNIDDSNAIEENIRKLKMNIAWRAKPTPVEEDQRGGPEEEIERDIFVVFSKGVRIFPKGVLRFTRDVV